MLRFLMKNDAKRVLIAMSGGVDSSAAAALLQEQGYVFVTVAELLALKGITPEAGVTYRCAR